MSDYVTMITPHQWQQEFWELVEVKLKTVRVRSPSGKIGSFSLKNGRLWKSQTGDNEFIGYQVRRGELGWLRELAIELHPHGGERLNIAQSITRNLYANCPKEGRWKPYLEVSVALKTSTAAPTAYARRRRVDVGYLEIQRTRGGRQFWMFGVEVKSCRADFKSDHKWKHYMNRFHGFAFASPPDAVRASDLPSRAGLYHWDGKKLACVREPVFLEGLGPEVLIDSYRGFALAGGR